MPEEDPAEPETGSATSSGHGNDKQAWAALPCAREHL
eukprot:CAMPEP_0171226914 /NCGR_PEP_ID=MMETSP0790-20130122/37570_1 /TAXON_ID=2925 /ORGANISM="Alexandrium catenella, Strain OF101" /LENGTH=36 /DNA_ID= /DNA_START= /DNA_END= /DNA_ORIENTATION=